jgi:hypothetical protein
MTIPNALAVSQILGRPYQGFAQKIRDKFPGVKRLVSNLTIPHPSYPNHSIVFNEILRSLINGLNQLYPSPNIEKARQALSAVQASISTLTFILHFFKVASKNGLSEEAAVNKVLDKFILILISTSRISYPSKKGKALIEALLKSQDVQIETIRHLFPQVAQNDIATAAAAGFNPMVLLRDDQTPPNARPMDDAFLQYMEKSRAALVSYGELLTRYSDGPKPLWVFLLRDAHLLYLLAEKQLPGRKMELDVCKLSLADPAELEAVFTGSGYNIGTSKSLPPIKAYDAVRTAMGDHSAPTSATTSSPNEVIKALLQQEAGVNQLTVNYQSFRRAQQILQNITIPEQVINLLHSSGIVTELRRGRPIVFVDTGFRGTLPMLLQTALTRIATRSGLEPRVHVWLDYVHRSYRDLVINAHQFGDWAVSPLDGCVSLNRILLPTETGFEADVFTTPFDAMRQSRILGNSVLTN